MVPRRAACLWEAQASVRVELLSREDLLPWTCSLGVWTTARLPRPALGRKAKPQWPGSGGEEGNRKSDEFRTRSTAHGGRLAVLGPPRQGARVQRVGGWGRREIGPPSHSNSPAPSHLSYSLAFTYQTGLRGVLRSLMDGLTHLRGNRRFWSFLTLRDRVSWDSLGLWSSHSVGQTPSGGHSPCHSLWSCPLHSFPLPGPKGLWV